MPRHRPPSAASLLMAVPPLLAPAVSCGGGQGGAAPHFTVESVNPYTPVKDQGGSDLCWAYAMLATIESERIAAGDSVNLSVAFIARSLLEDMSRRRYLSRGADSISLRDMAPALLRLLESHGAMPWESYRTDCNPDVVARKLQALCDGMALARSGLGALGKRVGDSLDEWMGPMPGNVYMLGMRYTTREFAHSLCMPGDYIAMTSFTHGPFWEWMALEVPDNRGGERFLNLPIDTLEGRVRAALASGHSVCWEGDASEVGFDFKRGTATLDREEDLSQERRQGEFESFETTDDHCMEIVGLAHDEEGGEYFLCKNSWGTGNPYRGLMFMSRGYFRMKTVAVVAPNIYKPRTDARGNGGR